MNVSILVLLDEFLEESRNCSSAPKPVVSILVLLDEFLEENCKSIFIF